MVGFHINVPEVCDLRVQGAGSGVHRRPPNNPEECINNDHPLRFIHIDKSGGTALRAWFKKYYPEKEFAHRFVYPKAQGHYFQLGTGCAEDCYVFFVRDPVNRWMSRFVMRQRQFEENPTRYSRVRDDLAMFPAPNDLAEALSSQDAARQAKAKHVFGSSDLGAPKRLASYYLDALTAGRKDEMLKRIVFVGSTANLSNDVVAFAEKAKLPARGGGDFEKLNAMPKSQSGVLKLSKLGLKNVETILAADYAVLNSLYKAGLIPQECTTHANCDM